MLHSTFAGLCHALDLWLTETVAQKGVMGSVHWKGVDSLAMNTCGSAQSFISSPFGLH